MPQETELFCRARVGWGGLKYRAERCSLQGMHADIPSIPPHLTICVPVELGTECALYIQTVIPKVRVSPMKEYQDSAVNGTLGPSQ